MKTHLVRVITIVMIAQHKLNFLVVSHTLCILVDVITVCADARVVFQCMCH